MAQAKTPQEVLKVLESVRAAKIPAKATEQPKPEEKKPAAESPVEVPRSRGKTRRRRKASW